MNKGTEIFQPQHIISCKWFLWHRESPAILHFVHIFLHSNIFGEQLNVTECQLHMYLHIFSQDFKPYLGKVYFLEAFYQAWVA